MKQIQIESRLARSRLCLNLYGVRSQHIRACQNIYVGRGGKSELNYIRGLRGGVVISRGNDGLVISLISRIESTQ